MFPSSFLRAAIPFLPLTIGFEYEAAGTASPSNLHALFSVFQAPRTITALLPEELPPRQPPLPTTVTDPRSQADAKHL